MNRRITLALVACLAVSSLGFSGARAAEGCAAAEHAGGEWRTFGRDLLNTRDQAAETKISPATVGSLQPAWTLSISGLGAAGTLETAPTIADGCLFVSTQTGWVVAANADTGALVWRTNLGAAVTTLAVANGKVFATISRSNAPAVAALDQNTGEILWTTVITEMRGSDADGSPVAFGDLVATGISCQGAEGASGANRFTCRGGLAIMRQSDGVLLGTAWAIPDEDFGLGNGGAALWSTPAVDMETGYAYIGSGNPFGREHGRANALLKIDVDPSRETFATVVDSYKATPEQYLPFLGADKPACEQSGYNFGVCELPDLDMGVPPTIYRNAKGIKMVSAGQGSGVWHTVRADTMEYEWSTLTGGPYIGHRAGGGAYDGKNIYTAGGIPGHIWALDKNSGKQVWVSPAGLGNNSFNPMAHANGVIFALGGTNRPPFLFGVASPPYIVALSAATGEVLFTRPLVTETGGVGQGTVAGGVVVARNTVYAPVNAIPGGGHIVAYRLPA